jgi:class 3 adenylate cyclase/tetratricopeptide (TPR) repeat protein
MTRCPQCREAAPPGARFCAFCGVPLAAPPPAREGDLLATRSDLPGERKHVSVLFADVTASMAVLTSHDAEEAAALFDQVVEYMVEAVRRWEGTVTQVLGDGIMALFGAPVAQEDHAIRACYAALRMQQRITAYGDEVQRAHGIPILIRVGINSGEVVLRPFGPDASAISAVGQTVHLASRLEQLAKPGTVLASADTVAMTGRRVRTRAIGPVNVKGLAEAVEVFEVVGSVSSTLRAESGRRVPAPLVGREAELARLTEAFDEVRGGAARFVGLGGEAGIGKSRLVGDFVETCRARGAVVYGAKAQPYTRATGRRVGLDLLRSYFGLDRDDAPEVVRERVESTMRALDPALGAHIAPILWQLGALEARDPFLRADSPSRRQRGFEANFRLIGATARRQPFVVVIGNLQWVDPDAEDSLKLFVNGLTPSTLVLVTYRPEYDDSWLAGSNAVRLHLGALAPDRAGDLLDGLLGAHEELLPLKTLLIERAGGNPFFLEESVHDLVQGGALVGELGACRLAHTAPSIHVPSTVRSMVEARIDRLPSEDKRVLQCAAVIGEQVPRGLLEAVTDLGADELQAALARLRQAEFLEEQTLFPEPAYGFRHSLTHDVAYGSLLHDRRRALHRRVLAALEAHHGDDVDEIAGPLAHHAMHAERWAQAAHYARRAGLVSQANLSHRAAAGFFEQALAALAHLPDDDAHRGLAVDLRDEMAHVLVPSGEHPRIVEILAEAEAIAAGLADQVRLARTLALLCAAYSEIGDSPRALDAGNRAVALAERVGTAESRVMATYSLGGALRSIGEYRRAVLLLRENLTLTAHHPAGETFGLTGAASVLARGHLAWSLAELGEFPEAVERGEEAIRLAQIAGDAFSQAHAQLALGGALLRQGRLADAIPVLELGLAVSKDAPFLHPPIAGDLGVIYTRSGRVDAGIELVERAVAQAERMGRVGRLSLIITHLGEAYFFAGRYAEATAQAERALALAVGHGERGNEVYAERLLGLVAAESEPPRVEAARRHLDTALALAEALGMRPLAARGHLALGRLARRLGETGAARRHLDVAVPLLESMQMRYWLDRLVLERVSPV